MSPNTPEGQKDGSKFKAVNEKIWAFLQRAVVLRKNLSNGKFFNAALTISAGSFHARLMQYALSGWTFHSSLLK